MVSEIRPTKLWDLPVRIVHWSFVLLMPALWWTSHHGKIDLHKTLGLIMLGLVAFRLIWGIYGSSTARFTSFVKGPRAVIGYLRDLRRGETTEVAGHNPAGGWSVAILLGLLAIQSAIGLFTIDVDGIESGPLNYLVSYNASDILRELHELLFNLILAMVALHLAAIAFYAVVKKDRLVPPMVTGSKDLPPSIPAPRIASIWRAIPAILIAVALAWWVGKGAPRSLAQLNAPPPPSASDYM